MENPDDGDNNLSKEVFSNASMVLVAFLFVGLTLGLISNLNLSSQMSASIISQDLFAQPAKNFFRESPKMTFIQDNSIIGLSPPATITPQVLGTLLGSVEDETERRNEIIEYVVRSGDTISSIAAEYDISLNTILWANDLSSKSIIKIGQKLIILPITGVVHHIKNGDTLSEIAKTYKSNSSEIIAFNELSNEGDIFIGDILVIPDGTMPPPKSTYYASSQVPIGSSYFICPTADCRITQGLHWYNAIDFGAKCGSPIYAAAAGTVQRVEYGWNSGAGNYITILHPNGVVTMYGHVQKSLISPGQAVSQGEMIALIGGKPGTSGAGISTGCHVHFGVHGSRNPFAKN